MNFLVGSSSPYVQKNPSFNVIYLEPENLLPVEYETYAFDLVKANKRGNKPEWKLFWKYSETYDLEDLSPNSFLDFAVKIPNNKTAANLFMKHFNVGRVNPKKGECDEECRIFHYCLTVSNDYDEWQKCRGKDLNEFNLMWVEHAI